MSTATQTKNIGRGYGSTGKKNHRNGKIDHMTLVLGGTSMDQYLIEGSSWNSRYPCFINGDMDSVDRNCLELSNLLQSFRYMTVHWIKCTYEAWQGGNNSGALGKPCKGWWYRDTYRVKTKGVSQSIPFNTREDWIETGLDNYKMGNIAVASLQNYGPASRITIKSRVNSPGKYRLNVGQVLTFVQQNPNPAYFQYIIEDWPTSTTQTQSAMVPDWGGPGYNVCFAPLDNHVMDPKNAKLENTCIMINRTCQIKVTLYSQKGVDSTYPSRATIDQLSSKFYKEIGEEKAEIPKTIGTNRTSRINDKHGTVVYGDQIEGTTINDQ